MTHFGPKDRYGVAGSCNDLWRFRDGRSTDLDRPGPVGGWISALTALGGSGTTRSRLSSQKDQIGNYRSRAYTSSGAGFRITATRSAGSTWLTLRVAGFLGTAFRSGVSKTQPRPPVQRVHTPRAAWRNIIYLAAWLNSFRFHTVVIQPFSDDFTWALGANTVCSSKSLPYCHSPPAPGTTT